MCKIKSICFWVKPWSFWTDPCCNNFESKNWQTLLLPLPSCCSAAYACIVRDLTFRGGVHLLWFRSKFWTGAFYESTATPVTKLLMKLELEPGDMGLRWRLRWSGNKRNTNQARMISNIITRCPFETSTVLKATHSRRTPHLALRVSHLPSWQPERHINISQ
jgi:hypothetical protein